MVLGPVNIPKNILTATNRKLGEEIFKSRISPEIIKWLEEYEQPKLGSTGLGCPYSPTGGY